jgi:hypothetical protein
MENKRKAIGEEQRETMENRKTGEPKATVFFSALLQQKQSDNSDPQYNGHSGVMASTEKGLPLCPSLQLPLFPFPSCKYTGWH